MTGVQTCALPIYFEILKMEDMLKVRRRTIIRSKNVIMIMITIVVTRITIKEIITMIIIIIIIIMMIILITIIAIKISIEIIVKISLLYLIYLSHRSTRTLFFIFIPYKWLTFVNISLFQSLTIPSHNITNVRYLNWNNYSIVFCIEISVILTDEL